MIQRDFNNLKQKEVEKMEENGQDEKKQELDLNFQNATKEKCIEYLLSLNDPAEPFYDNMELVAHDVSVLRVWARKAGIAFRYLKGNGSIPEGTAHIPAAFSMVKLPTASEVELAQAQIAAQARANNNNNSNVMGNLNDNGGGNNNNNNDNGNVNGMDNQQRGQKRNFNAPQYGNMPQGQDYELVSTEEAAKFRARGFKVVQADLDELIGIQFFKKVNGNGQVFYCKLLPNGGSEIRQLHQQRQRPLAYDSDDEIYDDGFQNQMKNDPFFGPEQRPRKRRKKVQFGHMVRNFSLLCV